MANLFSTAEMVSGYATARPPVHVRVISRAIQALPRTQPFPRACDIGCGAGVSTKALEGIATLCIGLEPVESMLRQVSITAPAARFAVGTAEALPLADHSIDLITAAGALNYANLERFFPEAARVLTQAGVLLVYAFSPGRSFPDDPALDAWFDMFQARYPPPVHESRKLDPDILTALASGFRSGPSEMFEIGITLAPDFYLNYVLTETSVAAAVRQGTPLSVIREWCRTTLADVWQDRDHEVLFRGYYACLLPLPAQTQGE